MTTTAFPHRTPRSGVSFALRQAVTWTTTTLSVLCCAATAGQARAQASATENVVLITIDGLRWQEVFTGADDEILVPGPAGDSAAATRLRERFWREAPTERRRILMPFLWSVIGARGQLYGNRQIASAVLVANGKNFSYPGYSEILTGYPDPRIDSNDKIPNPNVTVLEWLNQHPRLRGRVAVFGSWDVFPFIVNAERSGVHTNAGWEPIARETLSATERLLNQLMAQTPHEWSNVRFDAYTVHAALEYVRRTHPRVLYLALGEPDDWAHAGRYDRYLESTHRADGFIRALWEELQELPAYRDRTTFLITTDHGRGSGVSGWTDHGSDVAGSEYAWLAVLGPDTDPLGERRDTRDVTLSQLAATMAALLGERYDTAVPRAAPTIADVVRSTRR